MTLRHEIVCADEESGIIHTLQVSINWSGEQNTKQGRRGWDMQIGEEKNP